MQVFCTLEIQNREDKYPIFEKVKFLCIEQSQSKLAMLSYNRCNKEMDAF